MPFTRFNSYAEVLILAAKSDWLIPVAFGPSEIQG